MAHQTKSFSLSLDCLKAIEEAKKLVRRKHLVAMSASKIVETAIMEYVKNLKG